MIFKLNVILVHCTKYFQISIIQQQLQLQFLNGAKNYVVISQSASTVVCRGTGAINRKCQLSRAHDHKTIRALKLYCDVLATAEEKVVASLCQWPYVYASIVTFWDIALSCCPRKNSSKHKIQQKNSRDHHYTYTIPYDSYELHIN